MFIKLHTILYSFLLVYVSISAKAQQTEPRPYLPTSSEIEQAYVRQKTLDSTLKTIPLNTYINYNWQQNGNFWYAKRFPGNRVKYFYTDVSKRTQSPLLDDEMFTKAAENLKDGKIRPEHMVISKMFVDNTAIRFKTEGKWFVYDKTSGELKATSDTTGKIYDNERGLEARHYRWEGYFPDSISPDRKLLAYAQNGNLFIKRLSDNKISKITTDGTEEHPYSDFAWSPDSKHIIGYLTDPVKSQKIYYVLSSVPGTTRGQLRSYDYDQPGDKFTTYTPYIFDVEAGTKIPVKAEKIDFFGAPVLHWRASDPRYFIYEKVDRGHQRFRVIEVAVQTGDTRTIIDEKTNTFIYEQRIYTKYLPASHEIVWITEQDGWRHIYLVNDLTGKQKLVTKGDWVVRDIDSVDAVKRQIWFNGSGRNAGEDPYFLHYYRINFDGTGLVDLTPEKFNHRVVFSPDRKYFLDTYSQVNIPPLTVLRRTDNGNKVMNVEQNDITELLKTGIKLPEVFVAKARDGQTDIWGVVYRPSNFDPNKKYPIIEDIYAGPQDSFVPKNFAPVNEMQSIAELGFIVVQMDGMGTCNRSKAFHDVCWKNLIDAGFPDRILWMKALARKYPQADTTRVGVYGTSAGGQNATGAVLYHCNFYKAAVAACGCQDNRIDKQWWNEQWMGYPVGPHYEKQSNITNAGMLGGNLMLIVGEADQNVPPESTYRLVDALIKNNKDFDMLTVPGMGHGDGGAYGRRKKRDFFVRHLLHVEPPVRAIGEH